MARSSWSRSSDLMSSTGVVLRPKLGARMGESPKPTAQSDVGAPAPVSAAIEEGRNPPEIGSRASLPRHRFDGSRGRLRSPRTRRFPPPDHVARDRLVGDSMSAEPGDASVTGFCGNGRTSSATAPTFDALITVFRCNGASSSTIASSFDAIAQSFDAHVRLAGSVPVAPRSIDISSTDP
jgi:hypothetical protein